MVLVSRSHTELNLQFVSVCSFVHELMRLIHCISCSHLAKFQFPCLILWTMRCFRGHCGKSGRVSLVGSCYVMLCPVHFKQLRGGCCDTKLYHLPCTSMQDPPSRRTLQKPLSTVAKEVDLEEQRKGLVIVDVPRRNFS